MLSVQVPATKLSSPRTIAHGTAGLDRVSRAAYQYGLGYLWKTFESKITDLFVQDVTQSRVGVVAAEGDQVHWISTPEELYTNLGKGVPTLLILNRYNSWSRIDVTIKGFSVACHLARINPFFLHFVVGMGRKVSSKDEDFMSCYSTFTPEDNYPVSSMSGMETHGDSLWEICYNVRHFEKHHRDLEDPWSCRQSALHQSFAVSNQPTWVIIQPPEVFDLTIDSAPHPMALHLRYLHAALVNWREYLDSFAQSFKILNQRIAIPNPYRKFEINFSHEQNLHHQRGKLHHARNILTNTRNTMNVIAEHESAVAEKQILCPAIHDDFQRKLRNISREVDSYIETVHKLLRMSDDLRSMYNSILTFYGQELQHDTSLKLAQLAQADASGNRDMAVLADLTYKDSRSMRIATAIAVFYLPVNLVVVRISLLVLNPQCLVDELGS
ncbi:uncharacterized protein F4807DRAFT_472124 [Annulohypoxylon truncatum]|uniref:uncharacterized protein n=1 Tax=Annulohypoxylon truncatum TaxID=327061 RepID=UPI0020085B99|nr:uncharacterized protein F4807DRAFT_472124 [Annulohypoxylon truncatum]KAI1212577.1 hypothetical protein F4807DRAFT_472124 [Annulohypoxylon truncatum]